MLSKYILVVVLHRTNRQCGSVNGLFSNVLTISESDPDVCLNTWISKRRAPFSFFITRREERAEAAKQSLHHLERQLRESHAECAGARKKLRAWEQNGKDMVWQLHEEQPVVCWWCGVCFSPWRSGRGGMLSKSIGLICTQRALRCVLAHCVVRSL